MENLQNAFVWAQDQLSKVDYGTVAINVIVHDGKIQRIEQSLTQKQQVSASVK